VGELGASTYRARLNDYVLVEAELSEPAYAYLIAFNPTDRPESREQPVPQNEATRPPGRRDRLDPDVRIHLDDGEGLQAFALVASRRPLPSYTDWRDRRPPLAWQRVPATSGVVWLGDGTVVRGQFDPGFQRGTQDRADDKALLGQLSHALREMPGVEAVAVVAFAVDPAP
jgi:hypothetical protein